MSLMVEALKAKVGSQGRKLVLIKLADNANDKGECWPSYQHVADQCEMGRSTVKVHIKQLEKDGFLAIEARNDGKSSNRYLLTIDKGSVKPTRSESAPVKIKPGQESTDTRSDLDPLTRSESDPRTSHSFEPITEPFTGVETQAVDPEPTSNDGNENIHPALHIDTTQTADHQLATSPSREQFNMHWDWQPSTFLAERCKVMGINLNLFDVDSQEQILGEFRSFWSSKPTKQNQGGWEHKFAQRLKQLQVARESPAADPAQSKQAVRAGVTAQIMNISDTTW